MTKGRAAYSISVVLILTLFLPQSFLDPHPIPPTLLTFEQFVRWRADAHGVPYATVRGMIGAESGWDRNARGRAGEVGLLQVKLSTAREVMGDPSIGVPLLFDPVVNVEVALRYLSDLRRRTGGDLTRALVAYNRGLSRVHVGDRYARRVQKHSLFKNNEREKILNKISVVIPSYRNPVYLRLALSSLLKGRELADTEIVVVIDGFRDLYEELMREFAGKVRFVVLKRNAGMQHAINVGVSRARGDYALVTNEDIVAGQSWDRLIEPDLKPGRLLGIDCIEPRSGSLFGFPAYDAGQSIAEFRSDDFHRVEFQMREDRLDAKSFIFPFAIHRADFLRVGGFDASNFSGPYLVDDDFFLRCQLSNLEALRTLKVRFYHFSGKSTKHRDGDGGSEWYDVERNNVIEFVRKWNFHPTRHPATNSVIAHGDVPGYLKERIG